jgi:hypothetical protein
MKHAADFPLEAGLPNAPLHMPKQQLEPRRSLMQAIRATLWLFAER